MCGLFGAISPMGRKVNPGIIRALALINRERGTDSLGFFAPNSDIKFAGDPLDVLPDCQEFIGQACRSWFVAGHTRSATRGTAIDRNAHPFRYGNIIGAHNGIVQAPISYDVDSQYLFDMLNVAEGDYQLAFEQIPGWWGLSWFDGNCFYLQAHNQEIAIGRAPGGIYYYSSDWQHLEACTGKLSDFWVLEHGATLEFKPGRKRYDRLPQFVSKVPPPAKITRVYSFKGQEVGEEVSSLSHCESILDAYDPYEWDKEEERDRWGEYDAWEKYGKEFN